jgi:hypothetical protein
VTTVDVADTGWGGVAIGVSVRIVPVTVGSRAFGEKWCSFVRCRLSTLFGTIVWFIDLVAESEALVPETLEQ